MQLSRRQVKRLKARYQPDDVDWVRHGNYGHPKQWALGDAIRNRIVTWARKKYSGFNDSHLTEKLVEAEKSP